jgi:hypothetical protein
VAMNKLVKKLVLCTTDIIHMLVINMFCLSSGKTFKIDL